MKAIAAVLLFVFCVVGSIYCYVEHVGNGSTELGVLAVLAFFICWAAIED